MYETFDPLGISIFPLLYFILIFAVGAAAANGTLEREIGRDVSKWLIVYGIAESKNWIGCKILKKWF